MPLQFSKVFCMVIVSLRLIISIFFIKKTLKSIKSFKISTSVGFMAYGSHCSRARQYQFVAQEVIT